MRQERTCEGCGGTGRRLPELLAVTWNRCEACQGSGRVVESIPAADAMADAATLRQVVYAEMGALGRHPEWARTFVAIKDGETLGEASVSVLIAGGLPNLVSYNARGIFKAVPGLRDEARA